MGITHVYHWKHGWIPLDRAAELNKAHQGPKPGNMPSKSVTKNSPNPVGKDFRSMTSHEKIKAAEIMYGKDSPQHRAAKKKFGTKSPPKMPYRYTAQGRRDSFYGDNRGRNIGG